MITPINKERSTVLRLRRTKRYLLILAGFACLIGLSLTFSNNGYAKTVSVVTFNSEYGLILIDSKRSRAAYDLFETLNVPIQNGFYYQTKIFAPKDKSFRIACTAYGANHICAVIVYPSQYATLNFDTDEITLDLPSNIARTYKGTFNNAPNRFHFETEDKRLVIDWSEKGLKIKNFRFKTDKHQDKTIKPQVPGIEL